MNVREQQDAFEFFTQVVDQVDEFLVKHQRPKIFSTKFEGVFSDQKICQGCPHRYEREETFMALNLTVKCNNLQESLDQFVKGELLEGDNAYYCEKCKAKRNTIKRMCIKTLPSTLVIQLKRFHYDWETNRALKFDDFFQFPWNLDMSPYTTEGVKKEELGGRRVSGKFDSKNRYELVGVVVHSGQANAGHYYSFIRDRERSKRSDKKKWFKFNDTTVEAFEMNDETLATECFGGKYKVKKDNSNSSLPENRQRYWNAYILVYEAVAPITPSSRTSLRKSHSSQVVQTRSRKVLSTSHLSTSRISEPRESLSQLTDLLEKGEKRGIFSNRMPASIERTIQEENLRFLENRDVFSDEYYRFIHELMSANLHTMRGRGTDQYSTICQETAKLGVNFLLHSYFHLRNRESSFMSEIIDAITSLLERDLATTEWMLHYLASEGRQTMKSFLLECSSREVRANYSTLVTNSFKALEKHNDGDTKTDSISNILTHLVELVENDVANHCKNSGQFFWLLSKFAQMGSNQCHQLFQVNLFPHLIKFLLGVEVDPGDDFDASNHRRRWSSLQAKNFGELYLTITHLILACQMDGHRQQGT